MITCGFGFEYDPKRGASRAWIYKDGVKLWVDDDSPVDPPDDRKSALVSAAMAIRARGEK